MRISGAFVFVAIVAAGLSSGTALAAEDLANVRNLEQVIQRLDNAGVSLAQALRSVEREGGTPIRANFFVNDEGNLGLSVYATDRGAGDNVETAVLREYRGGIDGGNWNPDNDRIQDRPNAVMRAVEHQTLMQLTQHSLRDIVARAAEDGTVPWIQPRVIDGRAVFKVGLDDRGRANTRYYDLVDGDRLDLNGNRIRF